jgi:hypothetical protein
VTYRTEDERALLEEFLEWLVVQGIVVELRNTLVDIFLKTRLKEWGKNEK